MNKLVIPVGVALAFAGAARADFNPIPLNPSSFNYGVIVPSNGPPPVIPGGTPGAPTTASMDGGTANNGDTWNEQGFFLQDTSVGLPPAGSTFQAQFDGNHSYTMAPSYTANNAIMLDVSPFTNADFTLTTPTAYRALSFLTSGGNGGAVFQYTVQHLDGTTEVGTTNSADWFSIPDHIAWVANGRVQAQNFTLDNYNSGNPRLYSIDVALSGSSSPVTNINIKRTGGNNSGHSCIMAISGTRLTDAAGVFTPILGTGYTADIVVEATAPRRWDDPYQVPGVIPSISATIDNGTNLNGEATPRFTGSTWFEQGYYTANTAFGLPHPGATFTAQDLADHHYTMPANYTVPDSYMLDNSNTTATITFATQTPASALSFLASSGGGACQVTAQIVFADNSTESHNITIPDWYNASPIALIANGRIDCGDGRFNTINGNNPRLICVDISPLTETVKAIDHINLTYTSGGRAAIVAVSGAAGAVAPVVSILPATQSVSAGAPATFTANASGTAPITYQWEKGTNGLWVDLSGQTSGALSIASAADADEADYRVVAANAAGRATSAVATLTVLSSLPRITTPTDPITAYQPNGGSSPSAESVEHSIDGYEQKYLNFGNGATPIPPLGFTVTPTAGRTFLKVIRFYTANDAPERDPGNYVVMGSNDGGTTWSLIQSNLVTLPDGRNGAGTVAIDPTTNYIKQVRLNNNTSYGAYRIYFTMTKSPVNLMQIGEVEMLGTVDTAGYPVITVPPTNTYAYVGGNPAFHAAATGTPAPTFQWLKNGAPISGATLDTLSLNNVQFTDAVDYRVVVANSLQTITSQVAHLTVYSTMTDITQPGDTVTEFGDNSGTFWPTADRTPGNTIDNIFDKYQNGGSGFSAAAGFPPFVGPVGVIITPAAGSTLLTGLRVYTATDTSGRDPSDVEVYGSNDSGTTWTPIISSALNLPTDRNTAAAAVAPIDPSSNVPNALQEILFGNSAAYTSYKVQFTHTRDDSNNNSLQIGELELLGTPGVPLGFQKLPNGQFQLEWSQGTLQEATSLSGPWTETGATSPLVVTPTGPQKFYRLHIQ